MKSFNEYLTESKKLDSYIFEEEIIQEGFWQWLGAILAGGVALVGAGVAKLFKWMFSSTEQNIKDNGGEYKAEEKAISAVTSGKDFKSKEVIVSAMNEAQTNKFLSVTKSTSGEGPFNNYFKFINSYDGEKKNKVETTFFVNYGKNTVALLFVTSEDEKNFYIEHVSTYQGENVSTDVFDIVKDKIVEILKNTYKEFANIRVRFKDALNYFTNVKFNKKLKAFVFPDDTGDEAGDEKEKPKLTKAQVEDFIKSPDKYPFTIAPIEPSKLKQWCDLKGKETKNEKYYAAIVDYQSKHDKLIIFAVGISDKIKEIKESNGKENLHPIGITFIDDSNIKDSGVVIEKIVFIEEIQKAKLPQSVLTKNLYKAVEREMSVKIENIHISEDVANQFKVDDKDEHYNKINDIDIKEIDFKDFEKTAKENENIEQFKKSLDDYKKLTDEDKKIHVVIVCSKEDEKQICYFALVYSDKNGKNVDIEQYYNPELKGAISEELNKTIKEKFEEFYNNLKEQIQNGEDKNADDKKKVKALSKEIIEDILNSPEKRPIAVIDIDKDTLDTWCDERGKEVGPEKYYEKIKEYQEKNNKELIYALQISADIKEAKDDKDNIVTIGVAFVNKEKEEDKENIVLSRVYFVNELLHDEAQLKESLLNEGVLKPLAKTLSVEPDDIKLSKDIKKQFDVKKEEEEKKEEEKSEEVEEVKPEETKEIKDEIKDTSSDIKLIADDIKETQFKAWIKNNDEENNYFGSAVKYQEKNDKDKIFTIDLVKDEKPIRIGFLFAKVERDSESNAPSTIIINNIILANKLMSDNKIEMNPDLINNDITNSLKAWAKEMGTKDDNIKLEISGDLKDKFVKEGLDTDNLEWKLNAWFNRDSNQKELFNRVLNDPTTLEIALSDGFDMQGLVNFTYDNVKSDKEVDYVYQLEQLMNYLKGGK